jgi:Gpi18-like mannosyltransferase
MQLELRQGQAKQLEALAAGMFFLLLVALMPGLTGFGWDIECLKNWSVYIQEHGLRNAYGSGTDYLPFYQYVLWVFAKAMGSAEAINQRFYFLRISTLIFDFWSLYILYRWIDRRHAYLLILVLAIGNVSYSYNTLLWGQIDTVWTAFSFAALYYAWRLRATLSAVCMVLALLTKLQAVIFVPLWAILFCHAIAVAEPGGRLKKAGIAIVGAVVVGTLLFVPFMLGEGGVASVWKVVTLASARFPRLTLSADNMWPWLIKNAGELSDKPVVFAGITYKQVGIITFFLTSAFAMWPVARQAIVSVSNRAPHQQAGLDRQLIWLSGALVSILFFYCNTEMHERYAHAAGIFLTAYAFYSGKWGPLILFSIAQFLNLEVVLRWFALKNYGTVIFHPRIVSAIFLAAIVWSFVLLYRRHFLLRASTAAPQ